jgi:hypothetical protein
MNQYDVGVEVGGGGWGVGGWGGWGEESRLLYFLHTSRNIPCKHRRICCNVRNKVSYCLHTENNRPCQGNIDDSVRRDVTKNIEIRNGAKRTGLDVFGHDKPR